MCTLWNKIYNCNFVRCPFSITLKCPPGKPCFLLHGKRDIARSALNVLTHRLPKRLRISSEDKHDISIYRPCSPECCLLYTSRCV